MPRVPSLAAGETLMLAQAALAAPISTHWLQRFRHRSRRTGDASSSHGGLLYQHTVWRTVSPLIAQLLDTLVIAGHLLDEQSTYPVSAWPVQGVGLGRAVTARGPFHQVAVNARAVEDWRVLAPTDWHFAPAEPWRSRPTADHYAEQLRLLVLGFDPVLLESAGEVAHA